MKGTAMTAVPAERELQPGENLDPVLWTCDTPWSGEASPVDCSDAIVDRYLGEGSGSAIKSFGHDPITGVHFLLTRRGTVVHTDKAYLRYSHQLVLRNDGNRLRGLPRHDDEASWHPMLVPGTLYCLDTHSPHQGLADPRFADRGRGVKVVLAVDRDVPLDPDQAMQLIEPYMAKQLDDFPFDPKARFLRWSPPKG
jgi:hypothetical protein